ncbi:MAG: MMPL family transporter [Gemmatimonadales bacterium]
MLPQLSRLVIAQRRAVVWAWAALVAAASVFALQVPGVVKGGSDAVPGSGSVRAVERAAAAGFAPGTFYPFLVVLDGGATKVDDPAFVAIAAQLTRALEQSPAVAHVRTYGNTGARGFLGASGTSMLLVAQPTAPTFQDAELATASVRSAVASAGLRAGFRARVTGMAAVFYDMNRLSASDLLRAERVGLPITLAILLVAFGAPLAAALPLLLAMVSVTTSMAVLYLVSHAFTVSVFAENTVSMIGLGVGVDYALFVVVCFRRALARGRSAEQAATDAIAGAAHTVLFSGAAVAIGFSALTLVHLPFLKALALGGVCVVVTAVAATLTLLPALLAMLGHRVLWPRRPGTASERSALFWTRWAETVMRRPVLALVGSVALLSLFLVPAARMKPWTLGASQLLAGQEAREGYDRLAAEFGAGWMGPAVLAIEAPVGGRVWEPRFRAAVERLAARWAKDSRVAEVGGFPAVAAEWDRVAPGSPTLPPPLATLAEAIASPDQRLALFVVRPRAAPERPDAMALAAALRADAFPELTGLGATVHAGGASLMLADFDAEIFGRMWTVVPCVLLVTFLCLMFLFRSIVIPLKAIAMNLASVLAAYGFLVLVFQNGVGASLLGITPPGGLNSFIVLVLFTILFGLSMDYEVFLLTRVKEEYEATGDNAQAVARALAGTAGVISSAALIMVSIFTSFGFTQLVATREFGLGLAFAVAIDATLVRLVLVPSLMVLMGRANWWFPRRARARAPLGAFGLLVASSVAAPCAFTQSPGQTASVPSRAAAVVTGHAHPGSNVAVHLRDGSLVYGQLARLDADSVVVLAESGRIAFARSSVREVRDAGSAHRRNDGSIEYWFANPNITRLVFGPTGRTLAAGEGYFADYDILVGSLAVGVTDRITIGGGGLLVPNSQLWFVTPKVGLVRGESFNLAAGALMGGWGSTGVAGVGYIVGTFGGADRSFTLGAGNGFSGSGPARDRVFMVGGEARVSRRISLMTENYLTTATSDAAVSYGMRVLGERVSVDIAFFNSARRPVFPGIPFLGVVLKF